MPKQLEARIRITLTASNVHSVLCGMGSCFDISVDAANTGDKKF
jgi:hypothetical protein